MDPVTQGVVGATAALFVAKKPGVRRAAVMGAIGGMAPDLDIVFRSSEDPLFALEMHRQFTHSLAFIPVGGLLVAVFLWLLFYRKQSLKEVWLLATAGYATHGALDACTSYGTQLLWPFSDYRVAWDITSIIDPLITLPLLVVVIASCITQRKNWLYSTSALVALYFGFSVFQHQRAISEVEQIAGDASHTIARVRAMPTLGNVFVWRTLYEHNGNYYVNAIALPLFSAPRVYPGEPIKPLDIASDFPSISPDSTQYQDVERFRWFTDNWLVVEPGTTHTIGDLRYAIAPDSHHSLWHITLNPASPNQHVQYRNTKREGDNIVPWDMLFE
ncbi:metal-dependent hydrolase [Alteromonas gilva]|uniref:Metal-dependent hydrolase n=1 Tax=Alteromonas gilva TaxID=2987522 RepID=A0ABT5L4C8_9ALTE|nr:metal-dependent hydrolase [Alteromonas gilva]MDC8831897.1 metal-dependent hydrolase [Alteromonas gilva]